MIIDATPEAPYVFLSAFYGQEITVVALALYDQLCLQVRSQLELQSKWGKNIKLMSQCMHQARWTRNTLRRQCLCGHQVT